MKCLILCGGKGIIDPISQTRIPKALIRIGNRPLLWHVMKLFSRYGYNEFILALGQGGDLIKNYFINSFELLHDIEVSTSNNDIKSLNKIPEENWSIKLIDTGISASTGARIARCERYLKHESFFITYSDILADIKISDLLAAHMSNNKTLTITGVHPTSRFGTFYIKENETITYNANAKLEMFQSRINGGFMVASPKIFEKLSPINECNFENEVFNNLIEEKSINIFQHNEFWQNIDTERDIDYIQKLYDSNKRPWLGIS